MSTSSEIKHSDVSVEYFKGCLMGALLGDCIGGIFEGKEISSPEELEEFFNRLVSEDNTYAPLCYTDDTAMLKSVAESLIANIGFDANDMAKRFVTEYFNDPGRGYGGNVIDVFAKLKRTKLTEPYRPAREQFDGTGSYGNGGAMRIAPVALFCHGNQQQMLHVATLSTQLTHTHRLAVHGACLQTLAVYQALMTDRTKPLDPDTFITELIEKMKIVEKGYENEKESYVKKLGLVQDLLKDPDTDDKDVVDDLGNGLAAYESVATAIYVFLRAQHPIDDISTENPLTRAIQYAISLGGDTDTIASMAAAIGGAYHGMASIAPELVVVVEAADYIEDLAKRLWDAVEKAVEAEPER